MTRVSEIKRATRTFLDGLRDSGYEGCYFCEEHYKALLAALAQPPEPDRTAALAKYVYERLMHYYPAAGPIGIGLSFQHVMESVIWATHRLDGQYALTMTDLMVPPETLDEYLDANPPPAEDAPKCEHGIEQGNPCEGGHPFAATHYPDAPQEQEREPFACTRCGASLGECDPPFPNCKPQEQEPDAFDPLAVDADWEDAEDVAYKVAEAARRHYTQEPGAATVDGELVRAHEYVKATYSETSDAFRMAFYDGWLARAAIAAAETSSGGSTDAARPTNEVSEGGE